MADTVRAYELARSAALHGGSGHGAAVIRARGVAAWIRVSDGLPAAPAPVSGPGAAAATVPAGPAVAVLAAMTLAAMTAG